VLSLPHQSIFDLLALGSVLRGGLNRGGSTIPMQLLKNLVFHDLEQDGGLGLIDLLVLDDLAYVTMVSKAQVRALTTWSCLPLRSGRPRGRVMSGEAPTKTSRRSS